MSVNGWSLAGFFLQSEGGGGGLLIFARRNSGWGIVSIRCLACIGRIGFETISFSFGSCMATFDTEHLKIICYGNQNLSSQNTTPNWPKKTGPCSLNRQVKF